MRKTQLNEEEESRLRRLWAWIRPTMQEDGRKGFLSTYEEVHAVVLGIMIGLTFSSGGIVQYLSTLASAGVAGSRYQKGVPTKYSTQIKRELPHFVGGVVVGYVVSKVMTLI